MAFNELNSVEHFIIRQLAGINLNQVQHGMVKEDDDAAYNDKSKWKYIQPELLSREITDVFLEKELKESLIRLNPAIKSNPDYAEEVIHKLRAILIAVGNVGLVRANEEFAKWLRGEISMPFGKNNEHVNICLIDFEQIDNNSFLLTNQFKIKTRETKIPDIVMFVNGIPLVVGEAKTPVRPAVSWLDGAHDIHDIYENSVPQIFVPNVFSFATEGKELFIGGVRTPLEFWSPWRIEDEKDELHHFAGLQDVAKQITHLLKPSTLLDISQYFTIYATNSKKKKIKIVCRYQQYEGANSIVERVKEGNEEMVLDADVINNLMNNKDTKDAYKIIKILKGRLGNKKGNPVFRKLSERLEALRGKAEKGLINSIEFIKQLCEIAKDTLQAEKQNNNGEQQKSVKTALTELFLELKTDKTPVIVERIVNDIDEIVRLVRFDGWQNTIPGEREVQKSLRKTLLKYQLHKDEELFNKSYEYIKEYY